MFSVADGLTLKGRLFGGKIQKIYFPKKIGESEN
jgi:hypothetical protein